MAGEASESKTPIVPATSQKFTFVDRWIARTDLGRIYSLVDWTVDRVPLAPEVFSIDDPKRLERFDEHRKEIQVAVSDMFRAGGYTAINVDKTERVKIARKAYARFVGGLIQRSLWARDKEYSQKSLKGLAWSILARDYGLAMKDTETPKIGRTWRDKMSKLILSPKPDMKQIHQEFNKFISGDSEVFESFSTA